MVKTPYAIDCESLVVRRGDTTILDGITCRIERGQAAAILGPNGCGKTTFTRCLTGTMFATAGRLTVLDQTIGQTNILALRKRIGLVNPTTDNGFAHVTGAVVDAALPTTLAVCTGYFASVGLYERPTAEQLDRAKQLLHRVGLGHRLDHTLGKLSTGEQRRALIARALVHKPELLILDEPTAGLDLRAREQVLATIEQLLIQPDAPAVLMISHHVEELSPRTSQVLLMKQGKFVAAGKPDDVINPETLSDVYGCKVYVKKSNGRYWLEVLPEAWLDLV
ncbi:MAG: ABC transporter ATP-binding protein [Phycisphaeraceae bacterium]